MKLIKLLGVSILMFFTSAAFADPAIIFTSTSCGLLDGDGNGFATDDAVFKVVNSMNGYGGNINLKCHVKGVPNPTGKAVLWDSENTGYPCISSDFIATTYDWDIVISAKGNALLSCKFHFNY
jgi:hypothetical protein